MKRSFRTPMAQWMQWLVIVLMPVMGILTLFSQVGMRYRPIIGMVVALVIAAVLARWSVLRTAAAQELRKPSRGNA